MDGGKGNLCLVFENIKLKNKCIEQASYLVIFSINV